MATRAGGRDWTRRVPGRREPLRTRRPSLGWSDGRTHPRHGRHARRRPGRQPAKAAVGEPFPVTRHGVPRGTRRARRRRGAHRPRRRDAAAGADAQGRPARPLRRLGRPPTAGRVDVRGRGVVATRSPPGSTTPAIKIPAGIDVELMFTEGALLLERLAGPTPPDGARTRRAARRRARRRCATPAPAGRPATPRAGPRAGRRAARRTRCATWSRIEGPYPLFADRGARCSAPGTSSSRAPRAPTSTRGPARSSPARFRTAAEAAATRSPRWASTSSTCRRSTRSASSTARAATTRSTPGPTTPARRGRSARRRAATTRSTPTSARSRTSTPSWRAASELGLEVALDLALQAAPDHPWVDRRTRSGSPPAPTARSPTPRTRRRSTRTSTRSTSTTTRRASTREVLRVVQALDAHGVRIFRVDNPHTKPVAFWEWLIGEVRRTDPDVIFLAEAFTRPAMMRALGDGRLPPVLHVLHLAQREVGARGVPHARCPHETGHVHAAELLREHPRHPAVYLQYGGPAAFKIRAALAATGSPSWGVYAGFELFEHVARAAGQRGVPRLGEVPDPGRRLGRCGRERPHAGAVPHPAQRDPPRAPGAAAAAQPAVHSATTRRCWSSPRRAALGPTGRPTTRVIVVVNVDPHGTRETTVHLDMPALGPGLARPVRRARRDHRRVPGRWGEHNYVRLDPYVEPAHILTVRRPTAVTQATVSDRDGDRSRPREHVPGRARSTTTPDWFQSAVFYEVLVRSFKDSNGDGVGRLHAA